MLLQMMSYVTASKFKMILGILFSNPLLPKAFATASTKVRSAIIFFWHIAGFSRIHIRNQSHRYSIFKSNLFNYIVRGNENIVLAINTLH